MTQPYEMDAAAWQSFAGELGEPAYRGDQVFRWLNRDLAASWDEMTNVPRPMRELLAERFPDAFATPAIVQTGDGGTTRKALFRLNGEALAETVLMAYPDRVTACISSQAGCGMGCPFCATGQMGLLRNLTAGEIVAQVIWAARELQTMTLPGDWPRRLSNIVFMGMGEPLANYDRVWSAVQRMHDPAGIGLSARSITISTIGVIPGIERLARESLPVTLALSLHAPADEVRDTLVPLNHRYPIADVLAAARRFRAAHGRRVSIEYAMIGGVNDSLDQANQLAVLLKGNDFHVNLIPLNPTPGFGAPATGGRGIEAFRDVLLRHGVNATIRRNRGTDIDAACGQLGARAAVAG
ncbi:MAG: 23S rRNA (adenine(2503)-C(2))-methyltransferase RlmN [Actinomycetota bacterium]|nr:23S rRNA (adenine(2503)-C(2))-methyltransferase RlmN [Actinomycetota bacterium]